MSVSLRPIVVVDENPDDSFFVERRIRAAGIENPIQSFLDGDEALDSLTGILAAGNVPLPVAVFTDLKLLGMDGFELIARIRQQPGLQSVKVFVVSASENPAHRERALALGADDYLLKFPAKEVFAELISAASAPR